jgi:uncharacterized membrane protein
MAPSPPELRNIHAIIALEKESRARRTPVQRITDAVSAAASQPVFIACHVVWFAVWVTYNSRAGHPFDPFPFSLLTLIVSLEAIVLTGFVMVSQARMTQQADQRAHLDLQINLLAEQELTAILKIQALLAQRAGIDIEHQDPALAARLRQLLRPTDIQTLATVLKHELETVEAARTEVAGDVRVPDAAGVQGAGADA